MAVKDNACWKVKQHLPDGIALSHKIKLKLSISRRVLRQRSSHHFVLWAAAPSCGLSDCAFVSMQAVSIFPHIGLEGEKSQLELSGQ